MGVWRSQVIDVIKCAQHCHHSRTEMELVVKHIIGLKTLLYNVISEAIFYEDLFCKLRNIVRSPFFLICP